MIKELSETKGVSSEIVFVLFVFHSSLTGMLVVRDDAAQSLSCIGEHTLELTDFDHYVEEVDELLYQLETKVQKKVRDTLLIVPGSFMDATTGVLSSDSKGTFKKLFDELDLQPIGFVDSFDVIKTMISDSQNYALIEYSTGLTIRLIKGGLVIGSLTKDASLDPAADTVELLQKLHEHNPVPETFVIYTPHSKMSTVDFIRSGIIESGLCIGEPDIYQYDPAQLQPAALGLIQSTLFPGSTVVNKDIETSQPSAPAESEEVFEDSIDDEKQESLNALDAPTEVAGFVIDNAMTQDVSDTTSDGSLPPYDPGDSSEDDQGFPSITKRFSFPTMPSFNVPHARLTIVLSILVILLLGIASLFYFLHRAEVTLVLKPASLKQELEVPVSSFSIQKKELPLETTSTVTTTGAATVGDKSHGEVTVYSGDSKSVTLGPSQIMKSSSGLEFQLDKEIKLASSTAQVTSEGNILTVTSKQSASAQAKSIGEEYNLAKDAKLTFNGIPQTSVFGVVTKAFLGGSKRQIQTPSPDDMKKLQKDNTEAVKGEIAKQIMGSDEIVIPQLQVISDKADSFSAQPGKEAASLTLKTKQKVEISYLDRKEVLEKILNDINKKLPEGSTADLRSLQVSVKELKEKNSIAVFEIQAKPVPHINVAEVKKDVRGKSLSVIEDLMNQRYKVDSVSIHFANNLYFLNSFLPFFIKNISVNIDIQ